MMRDRRCAALLLGLLAGLGLASPAEAGQPAFLSKVPPGIPAEEWADLARGQKDLDKRLVILTARITAFNARPGAKEGTPEHGAYVAEAKRLDDERLQYAADKKKFQDALRAAVVKHRARIAEVVPARRAELKEKLKEDGKALSNLGLGNREAEFREWADLATEARRERERETLEALISTGLLGARQRIKASGAKRVAYDQKQAQELIAKVKGAGIDRAEFMAAIEALLKADAAGEQAERLDHFLHCAQKLGEQIVAGQPAGATGPDQAARRNAQLQTLAATLSWGVQDPRLELLVNEFRVTTAIAYEAAAGRVSAKQIEKLTALTEEELRAVSRITDLMRHRLEDLDNIETGEAWLKEVPAAK